jgi:hypothetical protein
LIIKDKIQIGGIWWKIKFCDELKDDDNDDLYGQCCYSENIIKINTKYPEVKQELALLHEIRHAIHDMLGYAHDERVKLGEQLIIGQQHYDHQIILQIIEWQVK